MSKLKLISLFLTILFISLTNCHEEQCSVDKNGSNQKSCGDEKYPELEVKDEKKGAEKSNETSREDSKKQVEGKEDYCKIVNGERKCGEDIKDNLNTKSDYYTNKKKQYKKPQPKPIDYPQTHKYEDLFLQKGHERQEYLDSFTPTSNYTDYYDFSVDQEELEFIKKERIAVFPPKKFQFNNQGNFLHFYKVAYEKKLPVLFSTDSMLYAVNENANRIVTTFLENVFIFGMKKFFDNLIHYIEQLKENQDLVKHKIFFSSAQIYYAVGSTYLQDGLASKYEAPSDIQPYVDGFAALAKKYATNTFAVMMKQRKINTAALRPAGFWRRTKKLANIWACMKFYNIMKLDLRSDLRAIFLLGKIIVDSKNKAYYYELRDMIKYLIGEEHTTPDFAEVYELGKGMFGSEVHELDDQQIHELNTLIVKKVEDKNVYTNDLRFLGDYIFFSQESFDRFRSDKEDTSFLFNKAQNLEDWVLNKLVDIKPEGARLMASSFELVDAMHHAGTYRSLVFNRYKGIQTFGENEKFVKFRDAIDIQENFEKAKYSIKRSMENEPQNWRKNLQFHYHYLLYKSTRRIKHSQDPIYKNFVYKESNFYTAWGAHVHFKRQIQLMTIRVLPEAPKTESPGIPEVILEPHLEFYKELETFWNTFRFKMEEFISRGEFMIEINYQSIKTELYTPFENVKEAISTIIKGIKLQETGQLTEEYRHKLNNLIYYDESLKWTGWYANLFDNVANHDSIFNFDIFILNAGHFPAAKKFEFEGASLFNVMRLPNLGIITIEDQYEKTKKMVLFAKYNVKEEILPIQDKPDVDKLSEEVLSRD